MEDRSALFNQLKGFSQRKLKKVETKVVTASGEQLVEKRGAKGLQVLAGGDGKGGDNEDQPARKLDLQVGLILPGFLIGSQDVAHDKSSLDSYGVTHILNLDSEIENKFEDDYNYKSINIHDRPEFELEKVLEDCFDFIDDGRHYGNVLIHCSGTIGLSRSTAVCIAYLMNKEKQKFDEAFNNVKEARSFVKPNEGFVKQLREYDTKLRGAQQVKESGIDDPFALRKKQEIEQEKAMVAGAASVKNRMKMFGATLDTGAANRSKSVSPSPMKAPSTATPTSSSSASSNRWGANKDSSSATISKSMTPEPRKSTNWEPANQSRGGPSGPPPPPPPMPTGSLLDNDKQTAGRARFGQTPPPPPPLPPAGDLLRGGPQPAPQAPKASQLANKFASHQPSNNETISSASKPPPAANDPSTETTSGLVSKQRMVFGRVPPPAMKIKGGLSIEKNDGVGDRNSGLSASRPSNSVSNYELNIDRPSNGGSQTTVHDGAADLEPGPDFSSSLSFFHQRCASPLVLCNNVPPKFTANQQPACEIGRQTRDARQFFELADRRKDESDFGQLPKRTVSLGPKRSLPPTLPPPRRQIGEGLRSKSPFLQEGAERGSNKSGGFDRAARELQSSLTELDKLIDTPPVVAQSHEAPSGKPPKYTSYLTSTEDSLMRPSFARQCGHFPALELKLNEPSGLATDDKDWKPSSSVTDLRSVFEQSVANNSLHPQTPSSGSSARPPRSASPNFLKSSPFWQNNGATTTTQNNQQQSTGDYTIRRTISTNSRTSSTLDRNPYRNYYRSSKGSLQLPLKKQFTSDSGSENESVPVAENPRAPSPSAALRAAKQQVAAKQAGKDGDHGHDQSKTHSSGLNRSSTKKLLNLIKTKTKSDLTLPDGDENDEIEALLGALESESIDNIDWDELGLDEDEVKNIIERGGYASSSSSSSSSSSESEEEEEVEEEEEEIETSTQHFTFRAK